MHSHKFHRLRAAINHRAEITNTLSRTILNVDVGRIPVVEHVFIENVLSPLIGACDGGKKLHHGRPSY